MDQDPAVSELAGSWKDMLGVTNIVPDLERAPDIDGVISEIRRTALEGALLIA